MNYCYRYIKHTPSLKTVRASWIRFVTHVWSRIWKCGGTKNTYLYIFKIKYNLCFCSWKHRFYSIFILNLFLINSNSDVVLIWNLVRNVKKMNVKIWNFKSTFASLCSTNDIIVMNSQNLFCGFRMEGKHTHRVQCHGHVLRTRTYSAQAENMTNWARDKKWEVYLAVDPHRLWRVPLD